MSAQRFLLKGGQILGDKALDLLIADGRIEKISASISDKEATVIDLKGSIVLPGLVDLHTHLREPGREDSETVASASRAQVQRVVSLHFLRWPTLHQLQILQVLLSRCFA